MEWSWAKVDWGATGAWAGVMAAVGVVFLAARLAERSGTRAQTNKDQRRLESLNAIYDQAALYLALDLDDVQDGRSDPAPDLEQIDRLMGAMDAVPVMELYDYGLAADLLRAREQMAKVRAAAARWTLRKGWPKGAAQMVKAAQSELGSLGDKVELLAHRRHMSRREFKGMMETRGFCVPPTLD